MKKLTFDDVLIKPKFSMLRSRKDVDISSPIFRRATSSRNLALPVISANMDTVTGKEMALKMAQQGAIGCLHRFSSIEDTLTMAGYAKHEGQLPMASIGLGTKELDRAAALLAVGVDLFVIDVAHGAQIEVVNQAKNLRELVGNYAHITVGNFATGESIADFLSLSGPVVDCFKVGIGPGSACTTRIKTGVGVPQLSAIQDCAMILRNTDITIIADGGIKTAGDVAKALGAGASSVMVGGMLAGTDETPGEVTNNSKKYRGSASSESYADQNKQGSHMTAEGESFLVPHKGSVVDILRDIEGGLRSAFTYTGSCDLIEFHKNCSFIEITSNGLQESKAHGKK